MNSSCEVSTDTASETTFLRRSLAVAFLVPFRPLSFIKALSCHHHLVSMDLSLFTADWFNEAEGKNPKKRRRTQLVRWNACPWWNPYFSTTHGYPVYLLNK
jgi:hypothetical protein